MATIKTDALSIQIKNTDGSEINIHPDVLAIEPTLEAIPVYQLVRNTSATRTGRLSIEYKIRAKSLFKTFKNDGSTDDPRNSQNLIGAGNVVDVQSITLTENDIKWYKEDIMKVDMGTSQFNSYIEQASVAIISSIRDDKDGAMFDAIVAGATKADLGVPYMTSGTDATVVKTAPKTIDAKLERVQVEAFENDEAGAKALSLSMHTKANNLLKMGAKNSKEALFAMATYGNKKSNIIILADYLIVETLGLIPNLLTSPKGYQDLFVDGEINIFKGYMLIASARFPETSNFMVITKGVRGAVLLIEQETQDQLMTVSPHPSSPETHNQLRATQMWKWGTPEYWFAYVSKR